MCIALCFSLFTSWIHAGGLPVSINVLTQAHAGQVAQHDCHTKSDVNVETSPQSTNHHTHRQCCLGFVADLSTGHNTYNQISQTTLFLRCFNSLLRQFQVLSLSLQDRLVNTH